MTELCSMLIKAVHSVHPVLLYRLCEILPPESLSTIINEVCVTVINFWGIMTFYVPPSLNNVLDNVTSSIIKADVLCIHYILFSMAT